MSSPLPLLPRRVGLVLGGAIAATYLGALGYVLVTYPQGLVVSADAGAATLPVWAAIGPHLLAAALALALPFAPRPASVGQTGRLWTTTAILLGCALVFTALPVALNMGLWYPLAKALLLIGLPLAAVALLRGAVQLPRSPWQGWWPPLLVLAVWFVLAQLAPWNPPFDGSGYDPAVLVVGALITALTAGFGEELFYRRLLQTRLEALLGAWPGVALASLLFAVMHLGSHGGEHLADGMARVLAVQGSFGLFMGVLWQRYRSLALVVAAHVVMNGWGVLAYFAGF